MAIFLGDGRLLLKIWFLDNSTHTVAVGDEDTFQSLIVGLCRLELNLPNPEQAARYMGLYDSHDNSIQRAFPLDGRPHDFAEAWDENKKLVLQVRL